MASLWRSIFVVISQARFISVNQSHSTAVRSKATIMPKISEDVLALVIGLSLFLISLPGLGGADVFGWAVKTNVWTSVSQIMTPVSRKYSAVKGIASLILTYLLLLGILTVAAKAALRVRFSKFVNGFTLVFFISYGCFALGHFAFVAATPVESKKFGIPWSLHLTGEAGFIVALLAGLIVGNFLPRLANLMKDAIRPELYIKIAIVLLGATLGVNGTCCAATDVVASASPIAARSDREGPEPGPAATALIVKAWLTRPWSSFSRITSTPSRSEPAPSGRRPRAARRVIPSRSMLTSWTAA